MCHTPHVERDRAFSVIAWAIYSICRPTYIVFDVCSPHKPGLLRRMVQDESTRVLRTSPYSDDFCSLCRVGVTALTSPHVRLVTPRISTSIAETQIQRFRGAPNNTLRSDGLWSYVSTDPPGRSILQSWSRATFSARTASPVSLLFSRPSVVSSPRAPSSFGMEPAQTADRR